jgi:hypothetical protein
MMNLTKQWFVCVIIIMAVIGCSGSTQFLKTQLGGEEPALVVPQRTPMPLPDHAKLALAGLVQKMRHHKPRGVIFDSRGSHEVVEDFAYAGFAVRNVDIAKYSILKDNGQEAVVDLGGFLHFADKNARATTVGFELYYRISKKPAQPPVILKSAASNTMPAYPVVASFMIPAEAFSKSKDRQPRSFGEFLSFAQRHGIDPRATAKDIALKKQQQELSVVEKAKQSVHAEEEEEQDLVILTFCFDRLNPESALKMDINGSTVDPVVLDFDGWRVLAAAGRGKMFSPSAAFTVDLYYQKDAQAFFGKRHIGRFSSLKYFPQDHRPRNQTVAKQPGPLEKGDYRLDVSKHADAAEVQSRLKELGYYTMTVDGAFGRGSKAALKAWSKEQLGKEQEYLTLSMQQALFKGSGR